MSAPGEKRDPWAKLRAATPARIGLGRSGAGLPTARELEFRLAHARARDAVHAPMDAEGLAEALAPRPTVIVNSAAPDRSVYLRRPDLGRVLAEGEAAKLAGFDAPDVLFIIADGLSSAAVHDQAAAVLGAAESRLTGLALGPVVIARQARVALGDAIGAALKARLTVMLVGERPGLSVANSLGAYLTYRPRPGRRDSERNCLSNIHGRGGQSHDQAGALIGWLAREALRLGLSGTGLKDGGAALGAEEAGRIGG